MYLLDTNTISYLQRGNTSIAHHIATKDSDEITTCSHVYQNPPQLTQYDY